MFKKILFAFLEQSYCSSCGCRSWGGVISGDTVIGTVLVTVIAFILLLTSLIVLRMENEKLTEEIAVIKRTKNL